MAAVPHGLPEPALKREGTETSCGSCCGSGHIEIQASAPCKNCSGLGYCATERGNRRFQCGVCHGDAVSVVSGKEPCPCCAGTGWFPNPVDLEPCKKGPEIPEALPEKDAIEKVLRHGSQGLVVTTTIPICSLVNIVGLTAGVFGFILLVVEVWALAAVLLVTGIACLATAFGWRIRDQFLQTPDQVYPGSNSSSSSSKDTEALGSQSGGSSGGMQMPDHNARCPLDCDQIVSIFTLVLLPNLVLIYCFSAVGVGTEAYDGVAPGEMDAVGTTLLCIGALISGTLVVFDWINWRMTCRACSAAVPLSMFVVSTILKGTRYSWAPILMILFLIPATLGLLRVTTCSRVRRSSFYNAVSVSTGVCAFLCIAVWLLWVALGDNGWNLDTKERLQREAPKIYECAYSKMPLVYDKHCAKNADLSKFPLDQQTEIMKACGKAATVVFMVYSCPFTAFAVNAVLGLFCFLQGTVLGDVDDFNRVQKTLKQFVIMMVLCVAGLYACVNLSSASFSLGSTLLAFLAAAFVVFLVWGYLEIGSDQIMGAATQSAFMHILLDMWHSDWTRAMLLGGFNIFIPAFFVLNMINMKVRKWRGITDSRDKFTPGGRMIFDEIANWDLTNVLNKVCLLAELFFVMQVGVAKVTYIFLSWLNSVLSPLDFGVVIILVVIIGFTMFLLPPVPGVPVYVFAGVVIATKGEDTQSIGYEWGIIIALMVSFLLKLVACVSQYAIGYFMGKSVRIQQLIGVDKVFTRAIEEILKKPGLSGGKVAILVGGPDWPTSVTCGILSMDMLQMVLGTLPVVVVVGPCVLAGAFLVRANPKEHSQWNVLSHTALSAAALSNMVSCCVAAFIVLDTVSKRGAELAKPRPEHAVVAEMTLQGEHSARIYADASNWYHLTVPWRVLIGLAAALHLVAGFIFTMAAEHCFRDFSISSSIEEDLDGNVFNVVIDPFGWVPIGIFIGATLMHITFLKSMSCMASARQKQPHEGDGYGDDMPAYEADVAVDGDGHDDDPPVYDENQHVGQVYIGD